MRVDIVRHHLCIVFAGGALCFAAAGYAESVDNLVKQSAERIRSNVSAQKNIDKIASQLDDMGSQYLALEQSVLGLKSYNRLLEKQVQNQLKQVSELEQSIEQVSVVERQILPLMETMLVNLKSFVRLDTPFLQAERTERLQRLDELLVQADVSTAEKFRQLIEAYHIENEYGRTIEAYRDEITLDAKPYKVNFLRVGRVALMYLSDDGQQLGVWDAQQRQWQALPASYRQSISKGLKVARKHIAPELFKVPVAAAKALSQ